MYDYGDFVTADAAAVPCGSSAAAVSNFGPVPPPAPHLHPNLASIYKEKIANLVQALNDPSTLIEANTAIRQLIERVQLVPENGELKIKLYGELAALLKLGTEPKNEHPQAESEGVQITMVAGAGFEPATFRL